MDDRNGSRWRILRVNIKFITDTFEMLQNKNKLFIFSILSSIVAITITFFINLKIAKEYLRVDGKTKAWFGIKELFQFGYQYYVAIIGIVSFILSVLNLRSNIQQRKKQLAIVLSIFSLIIIFVRIWRLFV